MARYVFAVDGAPSILPLNEADCSLSKPRVWFSGENPPKHFMRWDLALQMRFLILSERQLDLEFLRSILQARICTPVVAQRLLSHDSC